MYHYACNKLNKQPYLVNLFQCLVIDFRGTERNVALNNIKDVHLALLKKNIFHSRGG